ncbi:MAG: hypothetical protein ACHQFW_06545 [Chitinophagales bacterium]
MDNKHHIDQLFKGVSESYELKPSADVWNRIANELSNTEKTPSRIPYARYAALVFLFISVSVLTVPVFKVIPVDQITNFSSAPVSTLASANEILEAANNAGGIELNDSELNTRATAFNKEEQEISSLTPIASRNIKNETEEEEFIFAPAEPEDELMAEKQQEIIERIYNTEEALSLLSYNKIKNESTKEHRVEYRELDPDYMNLDMTGFYIGLSAAYNQTSILEYGSVFKGTRPIQPSLKFGAAKGILLGYNFSNKFALQVEYIYNSMQGQNYVMSEGDEIVQKSLSLNYDLIPLTAKIKVGRVSDLTNRPVVLNYIAGIEYGMLRESRLPQDKRYEEETEHLFKQDEVSLVLGLDYDIYVQDNLYFSIGAKGTFSNDISLHSAPLNDYAKRNFVFGLRASLNYTFRN